MRKINSFIFVSLDGYFEGKNQDINWHRHGVEENKYAAQSLKGGGTLLFGRVTYEMMASYWPTPMAMEDSPGVAKGMNKADKIVFSRTLKSADWENTRVLNGDLITEVKKLKQTPGKSLTILGSGSVVTQLAEQGLIDEYQVMFDPVVLGAGTSIFKNVKSRLELKLTGAKTLKSGVVVLSYQPVR